MFKREIVLQNANSKELPGKNRSFENLKKKFKKTHRFYLEE